METIRTISDLRKRIADLRKAGKTIGFVPTMGALHAGHLSLVGMSRKVCDVTVVSIFVNPTQFAPHEDFSKYPRPIEDDAALLEKEGVNLLFLPEASEIYPEGSSTFVVVEEVSKEFEGFVRPDHFRGVATVVSALFHIVMPDKAFFGQKDAQQVAVIKRMVRDQHFPVEIVTGDTLREADGLAMSSRNRYLSADDRRKATTIYRTLSAIESFMDSGYSLADAKLAGMKIFSEAAPDAVLEYLDFVHPETFQRIESFNEAEKIVVVIAARFGSTRLIDNIVLSPKT
jgi:pantoate--beta-alanine ligase